MKVAYTDPWPLLGLFDFQSDAENEDEIMELSHSSHSNIQKNAKWHEIRKIWGVSVKSRAVHLFKLNIQFQKTAI